MKTLLYLILCCLSVQVFGQNAAMQVKSRKEYRVFEDMGDTVACLQSQITYDKKGNVIEEIHYPFQYRYKCDTVFEYKYQYLYDTLNNLIMEMRYHDGNAQPFDILKHDYAYNESGRISIDSLWGSDTSGQIIFFDYDSIGNIKQKIFRPFNINYEVFPIDAFDKKIVYAYDGFNNCILIDYTGLGINKKEHYSYDKFGNCVEYLFEGDHKCLIGVSRYTCKYDDDSNLVEQKDYNLNGSQRITINYYSFSLITKSICKMDDRILDVYYRYEYAYF